jgi:hypothetical protein
MAATELSFIYKTLISESKVNEATHLEMQPFHKYPLPYLHCRVTPNSSYSSREPFEVMINSLEN